MAKIKAALIGGVIGAVAASIETYLLLLTGIRKDLQCILYMLSSISLYTITLFAISHKYSFLEKKELVFRLLLTFFSAWFLGSLILYQTAHSS